MQINPSTCPSLATNAARLKLDSYPVQFELQTRWSDVTNGHRIGLVSMARYYEESRTCFLMTINSGKKRSYDKKRGMSFVRQLVIEMLEDVIFPEVLTVGGGILRIGTTSFSYGFGVFQRGKCVSLSDAVSVLVTESGQPKPLSEEMKTLYKTMTLRS